MPELRRDPLLGRWVIISKERGRRPRDFGRARENQGSVPCPFCPGNEEKTPPEIAAFADNGREANKPGWNIRVIPNKFPALQVEGQPHRIDDDLFAKMDGLGAHEVIIETDDHLRQLDEIDQARVEDVFWAFRDRIVDLRKDPRLEYVLVFKNHGRAAGATMTHSHSQLIATPMVPHHVKEEMRGADDYYELKGRCIFCDIVSEELKKKVRVVEKNENFVAIAPFASRSPFEMWVLPRAHASDFSAVRREQLPRLGKIMKSALSRMRAVLDDPPYNFLLHTAPLKSPNLQHYHWHIEIMPKLTQTAGFEWGTGFYINPLPPENAAAYLREIETVS